LITEIISSFTKGEGRELVLSENVYNTLTEIISEKQNIQTFIIVLDNFNVLTSDIAVPLEFFSFLRSLANSYNVAYIISSVCALQEMCASKEVTESPFFNIFTNIELKTFSDEEGIKLLALYEADELYSVTKQLTGFHPYLLQQAIQILQDESRQKSIETVLKLLVENNKQFVMELLNNFPDQYPQFLINLAIGVQPSEKESYILTKLVQKGYISADSGFNSEIMRSILIALNQKNKKNGIINRVLKLIFEKK
jgi:hypothetical protein